MIARERVDERPRLVFFYSELSGPCRRAEGFLAQVLQRRHNHDTFRIVRVSRERQPELLDRFRVQVLPTLLVVEGTRVVARVERPRGCRSLEQFLAPWLAHDEEEGAVPAPPCLALGDAVGVTD